MLRGSTLTVMAMVLTLGALTLGPAVHSPSRDQVTPELSSAPAGQIQVADEITRRLLRLGFNYIRIFTARPAGHSSEVC